MGRRPVGARTSAKDASSCGDGTREKGENVNAATTSAGAGVAQVENGKAVSGLNGKDAGGGGGGGGRGGKNPLMGLLHYGSESDDEGASVFTAGEVAATTAAARGQNAASSSGATQDSPAEGTPSSTATRSGLPSPDDAADMDLPSSWQQCMDKAGLVYFWNTETGETTWEPPGGASSRRQVTPAAVGGAAGVEAATTPAKAATTPAKAAAVGIAGATAEEEHAVSDATSDTASEPDDGDEEGEEENEGGRGEREKAISDRSGALPAKLDIPPLGSGDGDTGNGSDSDAAGGTRRKGMEKTTEPPCHLVVTNPVSEDVKAEEKEEENAGEGQSITDDSTGVDDLLANIEAELLSGGGAGGGGGGDSDGGDGDAVAKDDNTAGGHSKVEEDGDGAGAEADNTAEVQVKVEEEDFSPLAAVEPGLDSRARKANADLVTLLAAAEGEGGDGGLHGESGERLRLAIELGAMLRCRLSDWREGGLDGTFFVQKVEEMGERARLSLGACVATPPAETPSETLLEKSAADAEDPAEAASSACAVPATPVAQPAADDAGGRAQEEAAKEETASSEGKLKGGSTKSHRLRDAVIETAVASSAGTADPVARASESSRDVGDAEEDDFAAAPAAAAVDSADSAASSVASDASAEALRAEQAAEKLRWADEVSAAAAAAVAAAAELSEARKKQAKVEAKAEAKAEAKTASRKRSESRRRNAEDGLAQARQAEEHYSGGKKSDDAESQAVTTSSAGGIVGEGAIDLGGVGDDDGEDEEEGEVTVAAGAVAAGGTSAQGSDESPTGIVIAREPLLPSNWEAVFDKSQGAYYYHNLTTSETTWVPPDLPVAAPLTTEQTAAGATSPVDQHSAPSSNGVDFADAGDSKPAANGDTAGRIDEAKSKKRSRRQDASRGKDSERSGRSATRTGSKDARPSAELGVCGTPDAAGATSSVEEKTEVARAGACEADARSITETLPSPWAAIWDKTQQAFYYHNTSTDETSWERPAAPAASSASVPAVAAAAVSPSTSDIEKKQKRSRTQTVISDDDKSPAEGVTAFPGVPMDDTSISEERSFSPRAAAPDASATVKAEAPVPADATPSAQDMRPSTLVWWSDAGDVWDGMSLCGLLAGYGPRRYRNLGGGYYMTTLELGPEWAAAAAAALGQGVADPVAAARVDWVCCSASTPGYGLFLRWAGDDDEQNLFDVPDEYFDDPPPDPAIAAAEEAAAAANAAAAAARAAAVAEAEAAVENAEAEAAAAAAVAATEEAEAAGSEAAAAVAASAVSARASTSSSKKRKSKGSATGSSTGSIGKKRKGAASLIDKWKAVASTAGEEAEKEAEKQEKMERWKARSAALDPDNPNFMPLGRKRR